MQNTSTPSQRQKPRLASWLIGTLIFVAIIVAVNKLVGWQAVFQQWRSVPFLTLLEALVLFASSYLLRAIRIYDLCQPQLHGRLIAVTKLSVLHLYANNMLPMRLGEGMFPLLMRRYFGVAFGEGLARLIWLRLLDLCIAGALLVITFGYFFPVLALGFTIVTFSGLLLLLWLYISQGRKWLIQQRFYPRLAPTLNLLRITAPRSMAQFARVIIWTFLSWGSKLAALVMITQALQSLTLFESLAGVLGSELSSILPIHGVAGSGSFEAAFLAGLAPLNLVSVDILGLAVNLHLFILGATSLFALICFWIPINKATAVKSTS